MNMDQRNELYLLMRKNKITARQIASEIGISTSMISQYFSGKANLSIENENNLKEYIQCIEEHGKNGDL